MRWHFWELSDELLNWISSVYRYCLVYMFFSFLNCELYSSFKGVSSDDRIVTAKVPLSLCKNTTQTAKTTLNDWSSLNNRDISNRYTITLRNKFDILQEMSETPTLNDKYENFINAHMEAAAECIPMKSRAKHRVPWETLVVR